MIKKFMEHSLYWSATYGLVSRRYAGNGVIFMLHSVVEDASDYLGEPIRCTVSVFEQLLRYLKARKVEIVTLNEAMTRLDDPQAGRFAVLTFDDGYRDNLTRVLPLLERYDVPATIYVPTGAIERTLDAWWIGLVNWLKRKDEVTVEGFGKASTLSEAEKIRTRIKITCWVDGDPERVQVLLRTMANDRVDIRSLIDQEALSAEELRELAKNARITIGGHTTSHPWLAALPVDEARREIADNRRYLQDLIQCEVAHFAYPFGTPAACGDRETELVAEAGFLTAVTCRHGCVFPAHGDRRFELPREGVHWYEDIASIACKSVGGQRLFQDLKQRQFGNKPVATMGK